MTPRFKHVAIIGVGLIGGSLGMVLKRLAMAETVVGIGRRIENLEAAQRLGAIDRFVRDAAEGVRDADLVVLATPVDTYERQLSLWAGQLSRGCVVTDVGSVKGPLVERTESLLPPQVHFVGAHPIAGKEKVGVAAGSPDLFRGTRCIITPTARTSQEALGTVRSLWEQAGSTVLTMDPFVHDEVLGAVSHLPHAAAFSLMTALGELEDRVKPEQDLLAYGGGGLRDTTRIAASSPEMWRDICLWNRDNLVRMIEVYERHLAEFRALVNAGDAAGLEKLMARAKQLRERVH